MPTSVSKGTARASPKQQQQARRSKQVASGQITPQQPQPQAQSPPQKNSITDKLEKAKNFIPQVAQGLASTFQVPQESIDDQGNRKITGGGGGINPTLAFATAGAATGGFGLAGLEAGASKTAQAAGAIEKTSPEGALIKPLDQYGEIIKNQANKNKPFTLKNTGEEYKTARDALKAGDVRGFAKNVKSTAFSRQMIDAAFLNSKGNVSGGKLIGTALGSAAVVGSMIGTYPWAAWSRTEAQEIMEYAVTDAVRKGDPALVAEAYAKQNEILDRNAWERIAEKIPFANIAEGFMEKFDALAFQAKVGQAVAQDLTNASSSGSWDAQAWLLTKEKANKSEIETQKAITDYWNASRKEMVQWERDAAVKARNEDADFWRKEREKTYERERQEREATAEFWMEYRRKLKQFEEDSAPSSLSFGLLQ